MPEARINYDQVAKWAGVSKATVHRAFANRNVQGATRDRVLKAAAELGYQPHPMVQALMTQVRLGRVPQYSGTLAYLSAFKKGDYNPLRSTPKRFIEGARQRATELGFGIDVIEPIEQKIAPERLVQILKSRGIPGVVIMAFDYSQHEKADLVGRECLPIDPGDFACVSLGGKYERPNLHFAVADQYAAGKMMARHLEELGYRRPVLILNAFVNRLTESRFQAGFLSRNSFRNRSREAPVFIVDGQMESERKIFQGLRNYTADVVVANLPDVLSWLQQNGLAVPQDIGFASFDCDPAEGIISGINQRHELVAAAAVDLLVQQINLNQRGEPDFTKGSEVEGLWVTGTTLPPKC